MTTPGPHKIMVKGLSVHFKVNFDRLLRVGFFLLKWELDVLCHLFSTVLLNFLPKICPHLRWLVLVYHRVEVPIDVLLTRMSQQFFRSGPRYWVRILEIGVTIAYFHNLLLQMRVLKFSLASRSHILFQSTLLLAALSSRFGIVESLLHGTRTVASCVVYNISSRESAVEILGFRPWTR